MITDKKTIAGEKKSREVRKPFLKGTSLDENTPKASLLFFGSLILVFFVAFIACATTASGSLFLRLLINLSVIAVTIMIFYHNGAGKGAEAVTRGEILYQKKEKGQTFSESEQKICYHPAKGFLTGLIGTIPFIVLAVLLALNTTMQSTESGTLPSWMQTYIRRSDIGNALINYTEPESMGWIGFIRMIVRICIMPYVNVIGYGDNAGMLLLERLSPLVFMIPAAAYGSGYLTGKKIRTGIHTTISENEKRRIRKDQKRIRNRNQKTHQRQPEQLN